MFNRVGNYINDKEFRFTIYEDRVHVINFQNINILEDYYISFESQNKRISIRGDNLVLIKLLENEMLIKGNLQKIEVEND